MLALVRLDLAQVDFRQARQSRVDLFDTQIVVARDREILLTSRRAAHGALRPRLAGHPPCLPGGGLGDLVEALAQRAGGRRRRRRELAGELRLRLGKSCNPLGAALAGRLLVVGDGLERALVRLQRRLAAGLDPFQDLLVEFADALGRRLAPRAARSLASLAMRASRVG